MGKDEETEIAVECSVLDIRFSFDVRCSMFDVHLSKSPYASPLCCQEKVMINYKEVPITEHEIVSIQCDICGKVYDAGGLEIQ